MAADAVVVVVEWGVADVAGEGGGGGAAAVAETMVAQVARGRQTKEGGALSSLVLLQVGELVHLLQVQLQRTEALGDHARPSVQDASQVGLG